MRHREFLESLLGRHNQSAESRLSELGPLQPQRHTLVQKQFVKPMEFQRSPERE